MHFLHPFLTFLLPRLPPALFLWSLAIMEIGDPITQLAEEQKQTHFGESMHKSIMCWEAGEIGKKPTMIRLSLWET